MTSGPAPQTTSEISASARLALTRMQAAVEHALHDPSKSHAARLLFARKRNRELRAIEYRLGTVELLSRPGYIELPVAGKCNLRCEMCGLTHGDPPHPNWTLAEVERMRSLFPYADAVNPTGAGEPMLVQEFPEILRLFKSYALSVGFYTNGTFLTPDKVELLLRLQIDAVNVSVDGATKETFERIRPPAKFERVVGHVRHLIQRRRELGLNVPGVRLAMVLMNSNKHELPALIRLAAELGADGVYTMFVSPTLPLEMPQRDPVGTNRVLREAAQVAQALGLSLSLPALLPEDVAPEVAREEPVRPSPPAHGYKCSHPWTQLVVWNDGAVSPCCRLRDHVDGQPFGNIKEGKPEELWNSAGFQRLRERLHAQQPPAACIACPLLNAQMT